MRRVLFTYPLLPHNAYNLMESTRCLASVNRYFKCADGSKLPQDGSVCASVLGSGGNGGADNAADRVVRRADGVRKNIEYNHVGFEYLPNRPVLKDVSAKLEIGKMYAFVGNSGGGKSTFVSLLPRFYDIQKGEILIDGVNVKNIDLHDLRENIAVVFQDNFLFNGTIRDNILLGKTDYTDKQLNEAIKDACLTDFIATLDKGLDTEIGERGVLLSGGQKQRVAIARAFMKNAPIVILDEATSALDNKSEAVVQQAIDNLMKNRTVLVIAHRLSTVKNADRIFVINEGRIVEQGSHDELLAKNGEYAALYQMQFKSKKESVA